MRKVWRDEIPYLPGGGRVEAGRPPFDRPAGGFRDQRSQPRCQPAVRMRDATEAADESPSTSSRTGSPLPATRWITGPSAGTMRSVRMRTPTPCQT